MDVVKDWVVYTCRSFHIHSHQGLKTTLKSFKPESSSFEVKPKSNSNSNIVTNRNLNNTKITSGRQHGALPTCCKLNPFPNLSYKPIYPILTSPEITLIDFDHFLGLLAKCLPTNVSPSEENYRQCLLFSFCFLPQKDGACNGVRYDIASWCKYSSFTIMWMSVLDEISSG